MNIIDRNTVILITGASSGIGRALAISLAKYQSNLILVGRNLEKLNEVADSCRSLGAQAEVKSVDATDAEATKVLGEDVVQAKGKIDVWVNNAGIGVIGSFVKVPLEEHVKVMDTNFFGYLYGSYTAIQIFTKQGRGILINNGSISSRLIVPHSASYNSSKHAIRALTLSIQQDLRVDGIKDVRACLVNPEVVDTPAFDHAANYTGVDFDIGMPAVTAEQVAEKIIQLIRKPQDEVYVGKLALLGVFGNTFFPRLSALLLRLGTRYFYKSKSADRK